MQTPPTCCKCQTTMECGFIRDSGSLKAVFPPAWIKGEAEWSNWTGVNVHGKETRQVATYRCSKCGYLESYLESIMKTTPHRPPLNLGMTILELLVVLFIIVVLAGLLLPTRPGSRKSPQTQCVSNQKQIVLATIMWINDQEIQLPPWRVPRSQGGTQWDGGSKSGQVWFQFYMFQRDLPDPKVLVCPSDMERKDNHATNWWSIEDRGFAHPNYRDQALSYFINLDCAVQTGPEGVVANWAIGQDHVVFGDRNLRVDGTGVDCSAKINNAAQVKLGTEEGAWGNTTWTNALHGLKGNLAIADGSVRTTTQTTMRPALSQSNDRGSVHLLFP